MTGWPLCLAEIALYAVLAGLMIAITLDARHRWRELLEDQDERNGDASDQGDDDEVSAVRPKDDKAPDDTDPPLAS